MSFHDERKIQKAKKNHKCLICQGNILAGDSYFSNAGKNDYGFYDYKVCERCKQMLTDDVNNCLSDDDGCVGEYTLIENLVMAGLIICPHCNHGDIYNYTYKDSRRLNVEFICENCEKHWEQSINSDTIFTKNNIGNIHDKD